MSRYRTVDGVMISFKTVNSTANMGDLVISVKEVKHNIAIDEKLFKKGKK